MTADDVIRAGLVVFTSGVCGVVLVAGFNLRRPFLPGPAPDAPNLPDDEPDDEPHPVEHEGATEKFGDDLHAMLDDLTDEAGEQLLANLRTSAMREVQLHEAEAARVDKQLAEIETEMGAIFDALVRGINARFGDAYAGLGLDAHGRAWLAAGLPGDTGEIALADIQALCDADEPAEVTA